MIRKWIENIKSDKDEIVYFIEKWYPFAFSVLSVILYLSFLKVDIIDDKDNILNAIISFTSILIGFIGTLIALLFSLNNNPIVKYIFKDIHYKELMCLYFTKAFQSGFILIICSLALFFRNTIASLDFIYLKIQPLNCTITPLSIIKVIWIFLLPYFGLSSYRIISIIAKIAFKNQNDIGNEDNNEGYDEISIEDYEKLKIESEKIR